MSVFPDGGESATSMTFVCLCTWGWLSIAHCSQPAVETYGLG